ncbi:MAG TPA: hypothetical protein VGQ76_14020 [Thermoanaerobaculia bacterium]|jgi:hypothetical protein|nr:hypothetical protein [Thermoanaerobaculia bacterium]
MRWFVRAALVFALGACTHPQHTDKAAADVAEGFTRQHAKHRLHASMAGSDCRVFLITIESTFDDELVESIHYGTSGYDAFGGAEQLARDRRFRAVVYRDATGELWTYGATTRDEARSLPRCRGN